MKVLSTASELYPLVKTGGLADVAGALPLALKSHDVKVTAMVPGYPVVMKELKRTDEVCAIDDCFGGPATLRSARHKGLSLMVLDAPHLYDRAGGPYQDEDGVDFSDNWRRFAAFSFVAAELAQGRLCDYRADCLHAHDWQSALAPAYLKYSDLDGPPSVMSIHNIAFQGQYGAETFAELRLPDRAYALDGVEYYGGVGFLKAGLEAASAISTVSPTYAQEIRQAEFGMGLEGLINARNSDLVGIVNGIDTDDWDPETDKALSVTYDSASLARRRKNRKQVETAFALESDDGLLICLIGRLAWQKGMDVVIDATDELVEMGIRLAVIGSGDAGLEAGLKAAVEKHPGRVGAFIGYSEKLAHQLQGGSDAILIPSRFEPCGLTQLYGLRYGCVPIVARTGGLADTIIDANPAGLAASAATGFQFSPLDRQTLLHAVSRAKTVHSYRKTWQKMQRRGMKADVSWSASAAQYARLYAAL
ncbi:MAG: glycogen synthase GlgA [Pseudomonadota bacterium]